MARNPQAFHRLLCNIQSQASDAMALDLKQFDLSDSDIQQLVHVLTNDNKIISLDLRHNDLSAHALQLILDMLKKNDSSVLMLELPPTSVQDHQAFFLTQHIKGHVLRRQNQYMSYI